MMDERTLRRILRAAVAGALPAAAVLTMACDPCLGPEKRSERNGKVSAPLEVGDSMPLSLEDCEARCRKLLQQQLQNRQDFGTIEDLKVDKCETLQPEGKTPEVSCEAKFTLVQQTYTGAQGCPVPGRIPTGGMLVSGDDTTNEVGLYFAQMASMEEAAVTAFVNLLRELEAYDAPAALQQIAREAIEEEKQHAHLASILAEAYGATPWKIETEPFALRSLAEIAEENAVEGCVRETFSAACAIWQSEHAEEDAVRAVMGRIVYEETRHAALSWAIDAWAMPQLTAAQRERCKQAKAEAIAGLEQHFQLSASENVRRAAGLPDASQAAKLFSQLRESLWV